MARNFIAEVENPVESFPRIKQWAAANGYELRGTAASGSFNGTPPGLLAALVIGEISGTYSMDGNRVHVKVSKDLPPEQVGDALGTHGLRLVRSY